jgi:hypothetical protein
MNPAMADLLPGSAGLRFSFGSALDPWRGNRYIVLIEAQALGDDGASHRVIVIRGSKRLSLPHPHPPCTDLTAIAYLCELIISHISATQPAADELRATVVLIVRLQNRSRPFRHHVSGSIANQAAQPANHHFLSSRSSGIPRSTLLLSLVLLFELYHSLCPLAFAHLNPTRYRQPPLPSLGSAALSSSANRKRGSRQSHK